MPTGTSLSEGAVRSIFALRAEGKEQKEISRIMSVGSATVSRVLRRNSYKHVSISQQTLEAIDAHGFMVRKMRGPHKKKLKDTRRELSLEDLGLMPPLNPAMPQAMKDADPAYAKSVPTGVSPELSETLGLVPVSPAMPQAMKDADPQYEKPRYQCPVCEKKYQFAAGARGCCKGPDPMVKITKAQAMTDVLALVKDGNESRARVDSLRKQVVDMEAQAKCYEDKAFAAITRLGSMGFTPQFLNAFVSECGLCTDGLFKPE